MRFTVRERKFISEKWNTDCFLLMMEKSIRRFFSVKKSVWEFMGGAFSVFFREYGYGSYQEIEDQNRRRSSEAWNDTDCVGKGVSFWVESIKTVWLEKMVRRLVRGLLAGLFVMGLLYFGGKGCLQQFFFNTGYIYKRESQRAEELQNYVDKKCLKATDL